MSNTEQWTTYSSIRCKSHDEPIRPRGDPGQDVTFNIQSCHECIFGQGPERKVEMGLD